MELLGVLSKMVVSIKLYFLKWYIFICKILGLEEFKGYYCNLDFNIFI